jgi:hypothetical protein
MPGSPGCRSGRSGVGVPPVGATASSSLPSMSAGMAWRWMAVGSQNPRSSRLASSRFPQRYREDSSEKSCGRNFGAGASSSSAVSAAAKKHRRWRLGTVLRGPALRISGAATTTRWRLPTEAAPPARAPVAMPFGLTVGSMPPTGPHLQRGGDGTAFDVDAVPLA